MNVLATIQRSKPVNEKWRPALIAYWRIEGCYQRAENLGRGAAFNHLDERAVKAIEAANARIAA